MKNRKLPIAIGVIFLLAACTGDPRPPEEIVAERAQARWDALVERDFQTAWQFYTPGYRQQLPATDFAVEMARRQVRWTEGSVTAVECDEQENRCDVHSIVHYEVPGRFPGVGALKGESGVDEIWLQIDGKWWYSADA